MKLVFATLALSLVSAASLANTVPSVSQASPYTASQLSGYVDGVQAQRQRDMFMSRLSVSDVRAELLAGSRLPDYTDGAAYALATQMFMSRRTRDQVRAEAAALADDVRARDLRSGRN